jgi:hypothetical protein
MPPPARISVASSLHPQRIRDFNYGRGTFELTREGDALVRVSTAFGLYPQPNVDFNYGGGAFKLAHEADAMIWESRWPLARIPNSSPSRETFKPDEPILRSLQRDSPESVTLAHWN